MKNNKKSFSSVIIRLMLATMLCAMMPVAFTSCMIEEPTVSAGGDDESGSSSSSKYRNAKVSISNAKIAKLSGYSNYKVSYTVKATGISASDIRVIGCDSNTDHKYASEKTHSTSYSYSAKGSRSNAVLRPYIKCKNGETIKGNAKTVSINR